MASFATSPDHRALAREVAARSVVLLRNEPVGGVPLLPLPAGGARLAVLGRLCDTVNLGDAGSSDVWDLECSTVLHGLRAACAEVVYDDGSELARAAAVAASAAAAVVVVGTTYLDEGEYIGGIDPDLGALFPAADEPEVAERFRAWLAGTAPVEKPSRLAERPTGFGTGGDRISLRLAAHEVGLIRAVAAANPRTVVVIQSGSAVLCDEWVNDVPAVLQAWYGGCQAGPGLADVLLGRVNPSGRLPVSIPVAEEDLPDFDRNATSFRYDRWHGWWHLLRTRRAPLFPFGFGLSYTTFELADVQVANRGGQITASGIVRNTGQRAGADVVQLYARQPDRDVPARLIGFSRVEVAASGAVPFTITAPLRLVEHRDPHRHAWTAARGRFVFTVAQHACDRAGHAADIEL